MTTDTIVPETVAASITPVLPVVAEADAGCSHDAPSHDHSHHDHTGGCCATTSPVAAAAAVEKATAMTAAFEAANDGANVSETETETSPSEGESTVDDGALIEALREVIDPELMINIVDLGLVYSINHTDRKAQVEMTLTSPACPAGPQIIMQSKMALEKVDGIDVAEIKLVMSPPWTPARMTDEARDQLGIF